MSLFRTILVPLDGAAFAESALPYAVTVARATGARLELVHVRQPFVIEGTGMWTNPGSDPTVRLEVLAQAARDAGAPSVVTRVLEGSVVDRLLDHADAIGADLLVMSTHGRGGLARAWLGSVADRVLRASPVPVLLVRPDEGAPDQSFVAGGRGVQTILVPVDGSPEAEAAVGPALELAEALGADLTLFRVVDEQLPTGFSLVPDDEAASKHREAIAAEDARHYLDALSDRLEGRGARAFTQLGVEGRPAELILDCAAGAPIDLVALSSRGRGGFERLLLGSVADKVIRGSTKPVLVFKPSKGH